jgi:hypothetical protein
MKKIFILSAIAMYAPGDQFDRAGFENFDDQNFEDQNFDPNDFDPENFEEHDNYSMTKRRNYLAAQGVNLKNPTVKRSASAIMASFDVNITNSTAVDLTVELFNALNSFVIKQNGNYSNGTYTMIPQESIEGLAAAGLGIVGYDKTGTLVITSSDVAVHATCKVSCQQFPYKGLVLSSATNKFLIHSIRLTVTNDPQIDNQIVYRKSSFLGSKKENPITPRSWFNPEQQQGKIVDITKLNWLINAESGLEYRINAGETVKMTFTITRVR